MERKFMANIAISELDTSVTSLSNGDLILVSKKNGDTYTSAKMTSENLKTSIIGDINSALDQINGEVI